MIFFFLCTFSGLLPFEICSSDGLTGLLTSSPSAGAATRCARKQQIGYEPALLSARRQRSSAGPGWAIWLMCSRRRQPFRTRTSLTSHGAQVGTTLGISNPSSSRKRDVDNSNQHPPLPSAVGFGHRGSLGGAMCAHRASVTSTSPCPAPCTTPSCDSCKLMALLSPVKNSS